MERGMRPYCIVCLAHSIEACGSEFRLSFFIIIFAFAFGSESSASDLWLLAE